MKIQFVLALALAVFVALPVFSQTSSPSPTATPNESASPSETSSPAANEPDAGEIVQLLNDFLKGASKNDIAAHERFWADDVIYTSSLGKRRRKADILADVRKESASGKTGESTSYSAEDIRVQQYRTTAIVAFRLVGTTTKGNKIETTRYLNTGTFLQRNGTWQVVAWQATKIPPENEPRR